MNEGYMHPVVTEALRWVGTPFVHRASLQGHGADCLGLIRGVWRALYGREMWSLPPYGGATGLDKEQLGNILPAYLQPRAGAPQVGDVLLFRLSLTMPAQHLGIALPDGLFVHATAPKGVVTGHLRGPWGKRVCASFILAPKGGAFACKG